METVKMEIVQKQNDNAEVFGGCPVCEEVDGVLTPCKNNDMLLHVQRTEFCVCHKHKTMWLVGSNLQSAWREMTDEEFERNEQLLRSYQPAEPVIIRVTQKTKLLTITHDNLDGVFDEGF